jgi:hypothetical protein
MQSIPVPIMEDQHDHTTPYPGDNGIMYEPDDEEVRIWESGGA